MKVFSNRIKERTKTLGLSQAELARRCKLTEKALNHYIAGRSEPNLDMLVKIAAVLDCTPNELLGVDDLRAVSANPEDVLKDQIAATCQPMSVKSLELSLALLKAVLERQLAAESE
jgi:XRE family transcriptional regulator, fatty acid utilization regulator